MNKQLEITANVSTGPLATFSLTDFQKSVSDLSKMLKEKSRADC